MAVLRKYTPPVIHIVKVCPLTILAGSPGDDDLPENMMGIEFDKDEEFEEFD